MDFPRFDGADPRGWVLKANQTLTSTLWKISGRQSMNQPILVVKQVNGNWYQFHRTGREWIPRLQFTNDVTHTFTSTEH